MEIRGSFHKAFHNGENWQDFTHAQFVAVVEELCESFGLFAGSLHLLNIELGVNVQLPFPSEPFLRMILFHHMRQPKWMMPPAIGIVIEHPGRFRIKLYDKATQYALPFELMRYELHIDRMSILKPRGIATVQDLLNKETWKRIREYLIEVFDEIYMAEPAMERATMTTRQRRMVFRAQRWSGWLVSSQARYKRRLKVEALSKRYAIPHYKHFVRRLILEKSNALIYQGNGLRYSGAHQQAA